MNYIMIFTAPNDELYEAFLEGFQKYGQNIQFQRSYFQNIKEYDCLVSPANSLGKMDGGMDAGILEHFGYDLEKHVQTEIVQRFGSYQPVGTSFILETGNAKHPFLAHTPTMLFPQDIRGTLNPYMAFKALLLAVHAHNRIEKQKIKTVLCPGFGTGVGMMPPSEAVKQMALAYELVLFSLHTKKPREVFEKEQELLRDYLRSE